MSSVPTYEALEYTSPIKREKFLLGYVDDYQEANAESLGMDEVHAPLAVWNVEIDDPYVSSRPAMEGLDVRTNEVLANTYARDRRLAGAWDRHPDTAYVTDAGQEQHKERWGDPESRDKFFSSLNSEAISLWQRELIPSAKALAYLSDPNAFDSVASLDGQTVVPIDETARKWFSLCTDAIGIRSRATVMSEAIKNYVDNYLYPGPKGEADESRTTSDLRWMSIACGTALPTIKAAVSAGAAPKLMLVDWDTNAMKATHALAEELNFEGEIETRRTNIFSQKDMSKLRDELAEKDMLPDVIDLMGIFEYTGENLNVDPAQFLRSAYDFLKPGGRLIFGQMRSDRPLSDFTMGVVSWPFIHMRSPAEVMQIVRDAGILPEQTRLFLPTDGVYTVGVIDKPSLEDGSPLLEEAADLEALSS